MTGFRMRPNKTPVFKADAEPQNETSGLPGCAQRWPA